MLKILLHLINVFLKLFQEVEHFLGLVVESQDLVILVLDCLLRDISNEAKVLLDSIK